MLVPSKKSTTCFKMNKKINGILLSAGLGTRLRPYTYDTPKPAIPFLSIPLAVYPLTLLAEFEIQNLVVNTHHLPEKIENLFHPNAHVPPLH